jgi:hypothetical protein
VGGSWVLRLGAWCQGCPLRMPFGAGFCRKSRKSMAPVPSIAPGVGSLPGPRHGLGTRRTDALEGGLGGGAGAGRGGRGWGEGDLYTWFFQRTFSVEYVFIS